MTLKNPTFKVGNGNEDEMKSLGIGFMQAQLAYNSAKPETD